MIRLFIAENTLPFVEGLTLPLNSDQGRYLVAVMRLGPDDEVLLFNGRDGEWLARIHLVSKKLVTLEIMRQVKAQPVSVNPPVLAVALVKRARLETIIEKATELGAGEIQLLITRRTNADHTNVARLQMIAQEAAEQTERLDVPLVINPVKLDNYINNLRSDDQIIYGDEDSTHEVDERRIRPMSQVLGDMDGTRRAIILIGPEGGFDAHERDMLRQSEQAVPVNLGPRILRADTAAISALTLYQAVLGDWQ
ncbi:MAG: 16S rRNA (uracil(1498)-N(3))-methyltransferase [Asticcacaulis sp.]